MTRTKLLDQWYSFSQGGEHSVGVRFLGKVWHVYFRVQEKIETRADEYVQSFAAAKALAKQHLDKVETPA